MSNYELNFVRRRSLRRVTLNCNIINRFFCRLYRQPRDDEATKARVSEGSIRV